MKLKFALKMLWAQRKKYYTIFTEQVLITIVLMICAVSFVIALEKYFRPGTLDVSNQFVATIVPLKESSGEAFEKGEKFMQTIAMRLKEKSYVEGISREVELIPYLRGEEEYVSDSIRIGEQKYAAKIKHVDKEGLNLFHIPLTYGKWFDGNVLPDGSCPAIVTQQLLNVILGEANAKDEKMLGKKFTYQNQECTIIGVVAGLKQSTFASSPAAVLFPFLNHPIRGTQTTAIKVKEGYEEDFYTDITGEYKNLGLGDAYLLSLLDMDTPKQFDRFEEVLSLTVQATPTLFFIIFAFLGTFGLFWMQSKKKAKEYALQIAIGLAPQQLVGNIVLESVLLSLFASIPALIVAFFIYNWTWLHVIAIGSTILVMVLFAVFSAWYPAYKVSRINPAEVLHYE